MKHRWLLVPAVVAVACAAMPDQTAPSSPGIDYGPLPDSVLSLAGWTRVRRPNPPLWCGGVLAWGCYTGNGRKLEVVTGLSSYHEHWVLEHEKIHMIQYDAHLGHVGTVPQQDSLANAIASVRMLDRLAPRKCRP